MKQERKKFCKRSSDPQGYCCHGCVYLSKDRQAHTVCSQKSRQMIKSKMSTAFVIYLINLGVVIVMSDSSTARHASFYLSVSDYLLMNSTLCDKMITQK